MEFIIKQTKKKEKSVYKTIYMKEELANKLEKLAKENDTSFNNLIISMIESFITDKTN